MIFDVIKVSLKYLRDNAFFRSNLLKPLFELNREQRTMVMLAFLLSACYSSVSCVQLFSRIYSKQAASLEFSVVGPSIVICFSISNKELVTSKM